MSTGYYVSKISDHRYDTPEGYLLCTEVPIARTGIQYYMGMEIGAQDKWNERVPVYRLPQDVFSESTIASFNGKPLTLTHPPSQLNVDNVLTYAKGHATNVRRGEGEYENCLVADILILDRETIEAVKAGEIDQISCGYDCTYEPYLGSYKQSDIVGNHVAVVERGRAGDKIAIRDEESPVSIERRSNKMSDKEKKGIFTNFVNRTRQQMQTTDLLKAVGLQTIVMDSDPTDVAMMVEDLANEKIDKMAMDAENEYLKEKIVKEEDEGLPGMAAGSGNPPIPPVDEPTESSVEARLSRIEAMIAKLAGEDKKAHENIEGMEALSELERGMDEAAVVEEKVMDDPGPVLPAGSLGHNEITHSKTNVSGPKGSFDAANPAYIAMKKEIAKVQDVAQRKIMADSLRDMIVGSNGSNNVYQQMLKPKADEKVGVKDSAEIIAPEDYGKKIKEMYHRKELNV